MTSDNLLQQLLGAAEASTGLSDWGDDRSFEAGLCVLLSAADKLPAPNRDAMHAQVTHLLSTRLQLAEDARQAPALTEQPITAPIIVVGLPRTGTTFLHDLIALDPASRAPLAWEVHHPTPPPDAATFDIDPRIAEEEMAVAGLLQAIPNFRDLHPAGAQLPAECNEILTYQFWSPNFWASTDVADYAEWLCTERAPAGTFEFHKRFLQQLQWKGPKGRWVLKSPPHLLDLDALLGVYPDARLVQTHRDPLKIMASLSNLVYTIRKLGAPDTDPHDVAKSVIELWGTVAARGAAARTDPSIDERVLDIAYRDLVFDPTATVRKIYDHFGIDFTDEFAARLDAFLTADAAEHRAPHRYDAAMFGIERAPVEAAFSDYYDGYRAFCAE